MYNKLFQLQLSRETKFLRQIVKDEDICNNYFFVKNPTHSYNINLYKSSSGVTFVAFLRRCYVIIT